MSAKCMFKHTSVRTKTGCRSSCHSQGNVEITQASYNPVEIYFLIPLFICHVEVIVARVLVAIIVIFDAHNNF